MEYFITNVGSWDQCFESEMIYSGSSRDILEFQSRIWPLYFYAYLEEKKLIFKDQYTELFSKIKEIVSLN